MGARMKTRLGSTIIASLSLSLAACAADASLAVAVAQDTSTTGIVDDACSARTGGALVTIAVAEDAPEQFTAWITNADFIAEAKRLLADDERGTPNFKFVDGPDCDLQYSFHVDAVDAEFPWGATEVCDAMPSYVNQNKAEWIAKNLRWCPWGSRVVSVVEQ
jgi:hypothetical protein